MKNQIKLGSSSLHALWYFLLVIALPVTTVVVFGIIYLWQQNLLLLTVATWLLISAAAYVALIYVPELKAKRSLKNAVPGLPEVPYSQELDDLPDRLKARSYWSAQDHDIWDHSCISIETTLLEQTAWDAMPDAALKQLALIAAQYHG